MWLALNHPVRKGVGLRDLVTYVTEGQRTHLPHGLASASPAAGPDMGSSWNHT